MTIEEVMTRDVITVGPTTPIHRAAQLMVEHGVSGLPVVDDDGRLVGIISEGDLILRQTRRGERPWWRRFFEDGEQLAREYQEGDGHHRRRRDDPPGRLDQSRVGHRDGRDDPAEQRRSAVCRSCTMASSLAS